MKNTNFIGRHKSEVMTPALLLDVDKAELNIRRMADFFVPLPCKLRPHTKTHKLPWIAHKQMRAGAIGITCAKLQDAKAFVEAGIDHILIANQIVGQERIQELMGLARLADIMVCVDQRDNAHDLSSQALANGLKLPVLVEVDVGLRRCGVPPGRATLESVQKISRLKGIVFKGLMGYEGGLFIEDEKEKDRVRLERNQALVQTKDLLERNGFAVEVVSAGGSNTYQSTGMFPGITDVQPGSYVTMDDYNRKYGIDFEQAITVLTTVISKPEKNRLIIDAGVKALSSDHGFSCIAGHDEIGFEALNEEHGKLVSQQGSLGIKVGEKLEIVPSHGCTSIPLHDCYIATRQDLVVGEFRIISRGATY